jgi:ribose 5-phosphate isomerase B
MRIALGADHAGVALKNQIKHRLEARGITCRDLGTQSTESVDYPDLALAVGRAVASGDVDRGILVCGTGQGMAMAANKIAGVRAAPVSDVTSAQMCRAHNDANVIAVGARLLDETAAAALVDVFLDTPFEGGRHQRRVDKMMALDAVHSPSEQLT